MKPILLLTTATVCLSFAFIPSAFAQVAQPAQQIKNWEPVVGGWVNEEQQRETPDGPWSKVASEWEIRMMPGGLFVDTPGKMRFSDGREVSWVQVWGYDPINEATYQHWFSSDGAHGVGTFQFDGTVQHSRASVTMADGSQQTIRCEWKHSAD